MLSKTKLQFAVKNLIQILLFFLLITQISFAQWVETSWFYSGDVHVLAISPNGTGGTNLFAGTYGGGVFL
ncbi:MAG: hypothetical protein WCE54_13180, partial [Ignavibacteriaceae bacterium]